MDEYSRDPIVFISVTNILYGSIFIVTMHAVNHAVKYLQIHPSFVFNYKHFITQCAYVAMKNVTYKLGKCEKLT